MLKVDKSNVQYNFNFILSNGILKALQKAIVEKDKNAIDMLEETINRYYDIIGYRDTLIDNIFLELKKEVRSLKIIK